MKLRCNTCGHEPDEDDGFPEGTTCLWENDAHDPCPGVYVHDIMGALEQSLREARER